MSAGYVCVFSALRSRAWIVSEWLHRRCTRRSTTQFRWFWSGNLCVCCFDVSKAKKGVSIVMGVPNSWMVYMKILMKWMIWGYPLFRKPPEKHCIPD